MTQGPGKEYGINRPPLTRRVWERSKEDATCPFISQNPSNWHPSWLSIFGGYDDETDKETFIKKHQKKLSERYCFKIKELRR